MKSAIRNAIAALSFAASALIVAQPARADGFGISIGPGGGVSFSLSTGGYCDQWGCPDDYWGYPIFYGPVYYDGSWYRGPVYYRRVGGEYLYWIHGGWRRDGWYGPRPGWARTYHYGPALGLDYYRGHGFHVRDRDWNRYRNHYRGGNDNVRYDRDRHYDNRYDSRDDRRGGGWDRMQNQMHNDNASRNANTLRAGSHGDALVNRSYSAPPAQPGRGPDRASDRGHDRANGHGGDHGNRGSNGDDDRNHHH